MKHYCWISKLCSYKELFFQLHLAHRMAPTLNLIWPLGFVPFLTSKLLYAFYMVLPLKSTWRFQVVQNAGTWELIGGCILHPCCSCFACCPTVTRLSSSCRLLPTKPIMPLESHIYRITSPMLCHYNFAQLSRIFYNATLQIGLLCHSPHLVWGGQEGFSMSAILQTI